MSRCCPNLPCPCPCPCPHHPSCLALHILGRPGSQKGERRPDKIRREQSRRTDNHAVGIEALAIGAPLALKIPTQWLGWCRTERSSVLRVRASPIATVEKRGSPTDRAMWEALTPAARVTQRERTHHRPPRLVDPKSWRTAKGAS